MARRKPVSPNTEAEVVREFREMVRKLREGDVPRDEFIAWFRARFGVRGKGILRSFLRQRELARGWDSKTARKKSSS